ncbi:MAG: autotransporter-associated beta strand repeat-containing protein, partial [Verrucomicrobiales bacterium]|nr:autotransporter-associated beta strand repeat-containing protein [Verrucomicrobiales bacterium]
MNKLIKRVACPLIVSGMAAFNAAADTLMWTGVGDGIWNLTGTNWVDTVSGSSVTTGGTDDLTFASGGVNPITVSGSQGANKLAITADGYVFNSGSIFVNGDAVRITAANSTTTTFNSYVKSNGVQFDNIVSGQSGVVIFNGGGSFGDIGQNSATSSRGTVILNSGSYVLGNFVKIGGVNDSATGLQIRKGVTATNNSGQFWIGYGWNAMITIDGLLDTTNSFTTIGRNNTGRVLVNTGTFINTRNEENRGLSVAYNGTGILEVSGGLLSTTHLAVGNGGAGTVTISGSGAAVVNTELVLGAGYGSVATSGSARLDLGGGVLKIGGGGMVNKGGGTFGYLVTLSGGTLGTTGTAGWVSALNMTLSDASGGVTVEADQDITLSGVLSGTGGLTKAGGGTLLLSGVNSYTGDTTVSAGTLTVDGG